MGDNRTKNNTRAFCEMIRKRSIENGKAITKLCNSQNIISPSVSILRQELDSMIRVIYLLKQTAAERDRLISDTLQGKIWKAMNKNDKLVKITDYQLVELSNELNGWTKSVYKFGCAFIHLSDFHNHEVEDPFQKLTSQEKQSILEHMRYYHGGPSGNSPTLRELLFYIPQVFEKIKSNLQCYIKELEKESPVKNI